MRSTRFKGSSFIRLPPQFVRLCNSVALAETLEVFNAPLRSGEYPQCYLDALKQPIALERRPRRQQLSVQHPSLTEGKYVPHTNLRQSGEPRVRTPANVPLGCCTHCEEGRECIFVCSCPQIWSRLLWCRSKRSRSNTRLAQLRSKLLYTTTS